MYPIHKSPGETLCFYSPGNMTISLTLSEVTNPVILLLSNLGAETSKYTLALPLLSLVLLFFPS